jgi:hypothetical protein
MLVSLYVFEDNSSNTNHLCIVHEDSRLFAYAKGQQTKDATRISLECPKQIEDDLRSMREDFVLNEKVKCM